MWLVATIGGRRERLCSETFQNTIGQNPVDDEMEISTGTTVIFPLLAVTPKRDVATSVYVIRCLGVSSKAPDVSNVVVTGLGGGLGESRIDDKGLACSRFEPT